MARVTISKKFPGGDLGEWVRGKISRIESGNREILESSVQAGSDITKGHIASRPTAWMAANRGKTGRIETERMLDAVGFRSASVAQYDWRGAFGWVSEKRPYFLVQEGGGKNTFTGGYIEPMYALSDASAEIWDDLKFRLEEHVRNA